MSTTMTSRTSAIFGVQHHSIPRRTGKRAGCRMPAIDVLAARREPALGRLAAHFFVALGLGLALGVVASSSLVAVLFAL
jgi:hypothetical protein